MKKKKKCPYCRSEFVSKNGKANGVQRWKCSKCKHNFTDPKDRTKYPFYTPKQKADAILAYLSGKNITKFTERKGIARELIYFWVKQFKERVYLIDKDFSNTIENEELRCSYKDLQKRKLRPLRTLYQEKTHHKILEYLAKHYDCLPTKPGRTDFKLQEKAPFSDFHIRKR